MGNYWGIHLPHFLTPNGTLAPLSGRGLRLAEYWTQIVAQWFCPVCNDEGRIGGWQDTFWDNGNLTETTS